MRINGFSDPLYRAAAKWGGTPEIQRKAQKAASDAMTDGFVEQIKEYAKKDAKKGIYMDKEFVQLRLARMRQTVSPDRSRPMAQVSSFIDAALHDYDPMLEMLDMMLGNYSVKGRVTPIAQNAEICSPDGEMIASYNSLGGGWTEVQTAAESKFLSETATVYAKAFKEARAELKAAQTPLPPAGGTTMDVRA